MSDNLKKRDGFGSKLGIIAAAAGSSVGLGNIYRFPCEAGANGGGAFILVYFLIVLCLGLPAVITEFVIGRRSQSNVVGAFRKLSNGSKAWPIVGYMGVLCALLIMAFYSTVSGWTLEFIVRSVQNDFAGKDLATLENDFSAFRNTGFRPLLWQFVFIILTVLVIIKGVKDGIERYVKILMPLLLVIMVVLCIKSLTLDGAKEGLEFLFKVDFSKITGNVLINALGQAFFSLSVGMGALVTYGSYISKSDKMTSTGLMVVMCDTFVAILAGVMIFPAAFSFGVTPEAGMGLVFNTLPMIFNEMAGGYFFCLFFFVLLAIAALTSTVSLLEVMVAFVVEEFGISRKKATLLSGALSFVIGALATFSLMEKSQVQIGGMPFFDMLDWFTANMLLPLGGLFIVIFIGWKLGKKAFYSELTNGGTIETKSKKILFILIKYFAPIAIAVIFISRLI